MAIDLDGGSSTSACGRKGWVTMRCPRCSVCLPAACLGRRRGRLGLPPKGVGAQQPCPLLCGLLVPGPHPPPLPAHLVAVEGDERHKVTGGVGLGQQPHHRALHGGAGGGGEVCRRAGWQTVGPSRRMQPRGADRRQPTHPID